MVIVQEVVPDLGVELVADLPVLAGEEAVVDLSVLALDGNQRITPTDLFQRFR